LEAKQKRYGEFHPSLVDLYNLKGVTDLARGDAKTAIEYFELAVKNFGPNPELRHSQVLNNLGLAYFIMNKPKLAVKYSEGS